MSNLNDYKEILFLFYIELKCRCPDWTGVDRRDWPLVLVWAIY